MQFEATPRTTHPLTSVLAIGLLVGCAASTLAASTQEVMLQCAVGLFDMNHTSPPDWAAHELQEETSITTLNHPPFGFSFDDTDDEEIQCLWIVPDDYDTSGTGEPQVYLAGWSIDHVPCVLNCGTAKRYVELEVSSRIYSHHDLVDDAWGPVDNATFTWDSTTCPTDNCFREDKLETAYADISDDVTDFAVGDLVYVRIMRDADVTNDLPVDFFLSGVRLAYESTQD